MGTVNSTPIVSQAKSAYLAATGHNDRALAVQVEFSRECPVASQIASAVFAAKGRNDKALEIQEKFAERMLDVMDAIPVVGHVKGAVHYALGQEDEGKHAMIAASRTSAVMVAGIGGMATVGPLGAVGAGVGAGQAFDKTREAIEKEHEKHGDQMFNHAAKVIESKYKEIEETFKDETKSNEEKWYGLVRTVKSLGKSDEKIEADIKEEWEEDYDTCASICEEEEETSTICQPEKDFDNAMVYVFDGLTGYASGAAWRNSRNVANGKMSRTQVRRMVRQRAQARVTGKPMPEVPVAAKGKPAATRTHWRQWERHHATNPSLPMPDPIN